MGKNGINRICTHWSVSYYQPNNADMNAYHLMIDDKGNCIEGTHKISDNVNCKDGVYAQHCANGNTGTIGIAFLAMAGYNNQTRFSKAPITEKQCEALCEKCAELALKYNIEVTPSTVYTHAEYDSSPSGAHEGKIDIIYLPFNRLYGKDKVGNYLRNKIQWYKEKLQEKK